MQLKELEVVLTWRKQICINLILYQQLLLLETNKLTMSTWSTKSMSSVHIRVFNSLMTLEVTNLYPASPSDHIVSFFVLILVLLKLYIRGIVALISPLVTCS